MLYQEAWCWNWRPPRAAERPHPPTWSTLTLVTGRTAAEGNKISSRDPSLVARRPMPVSPQPSVTVA
jgi:hypothetical protein